MGDGLNSRGGSHGVIQDHSLLAAASATAAFATPAPAQILADGAKFEEVSHAGILFAEGVVAAKDGMVYVSDLTRTALVKDNNPGGTIYRYDPATKQTTKFMEPSGMSNGLHVDKNNDLIICQDADTGGRAVMRRNLSTGEMRVVANAYQGKHLNGTNDCTSDGQGRIYFTDARYGGKEPMELPNAVYRVDPDGKITQFPTDIYRPNGIEVSPGGSRLFVSASNSKGRLPDNPNGPSRIASTSPPAASRSTTSTRTATSQTASCSTATTSSAPTA